MSNNTMSATTSPRTTTLPSTSNSQSITSSSSSPSSSTSSTSTTSSKISTSSTPTVPVTTSTQTVPPSVSTSSSTSNVVTVTTTAKNDSSTSSSSSSTAAAATTSSAANLASPANQGSSSSTPPGTIAAATVVPIVAVVLLILAAIWFWRKRKDRKNAEEMRRKEMEEYGFNPNHDPTLPMSSTNGDEPSTMRESDAGYRGWGATSTTRKASTTMSSQPGMARSDSGGHGWAGHPSPPIGIAQSDGQSGDLLVRQGNDNVTALGAAPAALNNRGNGVNRGPSNASSAYSGANYSDASGDGPVPHGSPQDYGGFVNHDEPGAHNPYGENSWGQQPVIRDVSARRNTHIESPSVVHQQGNSGIAQNF